MNQSKKSYKNENRSLVLVKGKFNFHDFINDILSYQMIDKIILEQTYLFITNQILCVLTHFFFILIALVIAKIFSSEGFNIMYLWYYFLTNFNHKQFHNGLIG